MEACLAAGRAVILVGDLNICPQPIDSCDPGDVSKFRNRADKKWLSAVMKHNGGYFVDLFRHFYPARSVHVCTACIPQPNSCMNTCLCCAFTETSGRSSDLIVTTIDVIVVVIIVVVIIVVVLLIVITLLLSVWSFLSVQARGIQLLEHCIRCTSQQLWCSH